ncbi:hypothetical protein ACFQMF_16005 [Halorubrum rutilum]|uniref:Uncharacterized protein n=1 Tax=Halorubrum rutilum TaxID=1364933 RepID=A0ABD6APN2_9EURY|nr:hypothetical protein [Halorubrum rutilum]
MNREALIDGLTQDILAYVMNGGFPERELANSLTFDGLDERFEDYELLLDLHFILKPDVVEFVEELSQRLRNVRTETKTVARTQRGGIDGHINWGSTVKARYSTNPNDHSLFVTENRSEDYDIPENIVLKRLLSIIYTTLRDADEYLKGNYDWVSARWQANTDLIDDVQRTVERNVHVRRIRDPKTYEPTERMLTTAENSRQEIYRDAADLLRDRQRLFDGDPDALQSLLNQTAITPDDQARLFELYVLFRFIGTLEDLQDTPPVFQTIKSGRQEIARIDGSKEIVLYHDTSASDRGLSFRTDTMPEDRELTRAERVQQTARDVASAYFQKNFQNHTGRPDVIVLEVQSEDPLTYEYLIAEVKHSTREETIRTGIKETLEYLAFLRINEDYVFGRDTSDEEIFGSGWNGLLVVQDLDQETPSVDAQEDEPITILQAGELDEALPDILENVLDQ